MFPRRSNQNRAPKLTAATVISQPVKVAIQASPTAGQMIPTDASHTRKRSASGG